MFEKTDKQADFPALERHILAFWDRIHAFEKLKEKNRGKAPWSFLDGPITANNPMGVHHAWNRTYKDAFNRYFAMTGRELRYQQGFDCQGLWVEVEVEKELKAQGKKLDSKRDIEDLVPGDRDASIDTFVQACKDRVNIFARVQTNQSIRLGYWMDWDRTDADWAKTPDERKSYFTMSETNNFTIWSFLKKCHARKMVYRGYDVMPWCGRCGVGISEQEMKEGYKLVEHRAAFVKLPLTDRPGENLLVWTTTPWTLTSNVGAAVNPELTYLKVKLKGEIYYLAKGVFEQNRMESSGDEDGEATAKKSKRDWLEGVPHLVSIQQMFKSKAGKEPFEIVGEVKGAEMIGWAYAGPFDDLPAQNHAYGFPEEVAKITKQQGWCPPKTAAESHRIVSGGKDVTETDGTGIVHTAPGCGQIDYTWGKENGLPPVAPIDDAGVFPEGFGPLTGRNAADPATADVVFEELKKKDRLFTVERYVHRYPHCWRCKTELLYRLVDEWFIDMGPQQTEQGFRGEIMKVSDQVTYLPESLNGRARERDWLKNMGDWMISKKRFWGLALPVWVDEKDPTQFEVIGSREELKARAVEGWDEFEGHTPHRPWIDKVVLRNPKTGNKMDRVPDVGNPWLDAGIVAFSTMKYDTDPAYWRKWYPADFITESFPGQFRNWFYALLALSTMMGDGEPPFKNLLGFATVMDQFGRPMHKSDGNSIEFIKAADEGYELFKDFDPKKDTKAALADPEIPKGYVSFREEVVDRKGQPFKRVATTYKPIGADVMRWLYCRQNPSLNLNFGPGPTDEVRAKFILKVWNCYSFLVDYARLDGFTPGPQHAAGFTDIDRWILSDLQKLIGAAHAAFTTYNTMAFCLEAEKFVDDRLSNWYIRRNRGRFQSNAADLDAAGRRDKFAAHQTLYTVMTTLCQLVAPVIPFLAEVMYQNLRLDADPESVHLCDYPTADPALADEQLSADMDALLDLVSLGGAARNVAKFKVRQPLAELRIQSEHDSVMRAVARFADQIREELNVKKVTRHDGSPLLTASAKLNKKTAAAKLGPKLKEAEAELAALDATRLAFPLTLAGIPLDSADIQIEYQAEPGWAGVAGRGTQVAIDGRVTEDLAREGMARDIIRQVQDHRKNSGLQIEDRISLHLGTAAEKLTAAIAAHRDYIAGETLTVEWATAPHTGAVEVKIDGQGLTISLKKV